MLHVFNIHLAAESFSPVKVFHRRPLGKVGQSGIALAEEINGQWWMERERHDLSSSPITCLGLHRQF